jgi:hypothetical protein
MKLTKLALEAITVPPLQLGYKIQGRNCCSELCHFNSSWVLILVINCIYGRQNNAFKPLTAIMKTLEQRYNVKNSLMLSEDVKDIAIESYEIKAGLPNPCLFK